VPARSLSAGGRPLLRFPCPVTAPARVRGACTRVQQVFRREPWFSLSSPALRDPSPSPLLFFRRAAGTRPAIRTQRSHRHRRSAARCCARRTHSQQSSPALVTLGLRGLPVPAVCKRGSFGGASGRAGDPPAAMRCGVAAGRSRCGGEPGERVWQPGGAQARSPQPYQTCEGAAPCGQPRANFGHKDALKSQTGGAAKSGTQTLLAAGQPGVLWERAVWGHTRQRANWAAPSGPRRGGGGRPKAGAPRREQRGSAVASSGAFRGRAAPSLVQTAGSSAGASSQAGGIKKGKLQGARLCRFRARQLDRCCSSWLKALRPSTSPSSGGACAARGAEGPAGSVAAGRGGEAGGGTRSGSQAAPPAPRLFQGPRARRARRGVRRGGTPPNVQPHAARPGLGAPGALRRGLWAVIARDLVI
jgi:hypothetical protein